MFKTSVFLLSLLITQAAAQMPFSDNLAHTYSIVARDSATGELGVAVQTHWFAVGTRVSWAESGVGAIATQSFTNPSFGPRGLALLKQGLSAGQVVDVLIESDEGRDVRQLAVVDADGNSAAWTGKKCIQAAGHHNESNFSVQANLMLNDRVWPAMAKEFKESDGPLAERLIAALKAGQGEGGDIRGKQSAALIVVSGEPTGKVWRDRLIDLRVDDHAEPVTELSRLLSVYRAYQHMNAGDTAMEKDDVDAALDEYGAASELMPDNLEIRYWQAVSLANAGHLERAMPIFKSVFAADENWRILTRRLPEVELLKVTDEVLQSILAL